MPPNEKDVIPDLPDVTAMRNELLGLRAAFLVNTTKLGTICSAVGIKAEQEMSDFDAAVKRVVLKHLPPAKEFADQIHLLYQGNGKSMNDAYKEVVIALGALGFYHA